MKKIFKKTKFVSVFAFLVLTLFYSCGFIDANNEVVAEVVKKDTLSSMLSANAETEEEEYEKIENSHTLTAIFDENGNVVPQEAIPNQNEEPTKNNSSNQTQVNSNLEHLNTKNVKNNENNKSENNIGTVSANVNNNSKTNQKNTTEIKPNFKKTEIPEKVEIDTEQNQKSQKANNAIPNF